MTSQRIIKDHSSSTSPSGLSPSLTHRWEWTSFPSFPGCDEIAEKEQREWRRIGCPLSPLKEKLIKCEAKASVAVIANSITISARKSSPPLHNGGSTTTKQNDVLSLPSPWPNQLVNGTREAKEPTTCLFLPSRFFLRRTP